MMKINWQPIETHPNDQPILCAILIDDGGTVDTVGVFEWSTDDKWHKHRERHERGLWLNVTTGCDGCWRTQYEFTHWAPLPIAAAEVYRRALREIRQLTDDSTVSQARAIARLAMESEQNGNKS